MYMLIFYLWYSYVSEHVLIISVLKWILSNSILHKENEIHVDRNIAKVSIWIVLRIESGRPLSGFSLT